MPNLTKNALLAGASGIFVSAISRVSHIYPPLADLYILDIVGTGLLILCLFLLFQVRSDYPESHSRHIVISLVLLISSILLLYGGFALQKFTLESLRTLGAIPGTGVFWVSAGMIIISLLILPIARILPLQEMLDTPRRRASMSAFITSMVISVFLGVLIIDAVLNLTNSLAIISSKTPYDTQGAISTIQATIFAEDVFLIFLIVEDALFLPVYFLAYHRGLGLNLGVIEDVFFIYSDGRLIYHGTRRVDPAEIDADILASMLTAVSDFVKDSFSSKLSGSLESMKIGNYNIFLLGGKYTTLAVTSLGIPLRPLREHLSTILHQIEEKYQHTLKHWSGARNELDDCILELKQKLRISQ